MPEASKCSYFDVAGGEKRNDCTCNVSEMAASLSWSLANVTSERGVSYTGREGREGEETESGGEGEILGSGEGEEGREKEERQ